MTTELPQQDARNTTIEAVLEQAVTERVQELVEQRVQEVTTDLRERISNLKDEVEELRDELAAERDARRNAQAQVEELAKQVENEHDARLSALEAKANGTRSMIAELQSRELEKGAHLQYDNIEANIMDELLDVDGNRIERITKEDGGRYARLPGEEDALNRGGVVTHSTADLLPIQRLARYDDEMLANVTNRKPDELAAKAWRERDDPGKYSLWSTGSNDVRVYLTSSDLTDWILAREHGISKNYAQELARRTMDALLELSKHRLAKKQKTRRADGLTYKENRLVLKSDVDLPGEVSPGDAITGGPATDDGASA